MAQTVRKITPAILKQIIVQEARKLQLESDAMAKGLDDTEDVKADEKGADELAQSLAHQIDYMKALDIHERTLLNKLAKINETRSRLVKKIRARR